MTQHLSYALRPNGTALGLRWLVLVVILFGTILSSMGGTNSHGIAPIAAGLHIAPTSLDPSHDHAHEEAGSAWAVASDGAVADHPHHGADHSHDKAHALPDIWRSAVLPLPGWFGLVRPWIEMVQASRLERPPMG